MSVNQNALNKVKLALRITEDEFDDELADLMSAALTDLGIAGVNGAGAVINDPIVRLAVITYCKMHFGEPDQYDRLKASYDEQKAQLSMASNYTEWN